MGSLELALFATCLQADFLLSLFLDPEDGSEMILWNVGCFSTDNTALPPRSYNSS
jgi:hypothetical protein